MLTMLTSEVMIRIFDHDPSKTLVFEAIEVISDGLQVFISFNPKCLIFHDFRSWLSALRNGIVELQQNCLPKTRNGLDGIRYTGSRLEFVAVVTLLTASDCMRSTVKKFDLELFEAVHEDLISVARQLGSSLQPKFLDALDLRHFDKY